MTTGIVIQSSQTNRKFWGDLEILSSLRNEYQKLLELGKQVRKKFKRKQSAEMAKTLFQEGLRLSRMGTRFGHAHTSVYLGDKSMTGKLKIIRTYTNQSSSSVEEKDEPLIPELLNDIVLYEIIPKLPWKAFHVLSLVNRGWQRAVHSHPLYGDELFQDDEQVYHPGYTLHGNGLRRAYRSLFLKVEEQSVWRVLKPFGREYLKKLFLSQGQFHSSSEPWPYSRPLFFPNLHDFLFAAVGPRQRAEFYIYATRMIKDHVFVVVAVKSYREISEPRNLQICVLRSKGFGSEKEKIIWEKINPSVSSYDMLGDLEGF